VVVGFVRVERVLRGREVGRKVFGGASEVFFFPKKTVFVDMVKAMASLTRRTVRSLRRCGRTQHAVTTTSHLERRSYRSSRYVKHD
jgi:hypothetical protein